MKPHALLSVIGAMTLLSPTSALAADFDSIGSLSRFYNDTFSGRESNMKWFFFGGGEDTAGVWEGAAVTIADAVWPEFNGEWYLKAGIPEHWELWDTPAFDNVQAIANGGRPGVSDGDGIPGGFVIAGHPGFVQGTDTIADNDDPRPSLTGNPSHMWAPGNDNGNQFQSPHTTIEVKLPGNTDYTGTEVELVESIWTDLHGQSYYLEFLANDGGATRHLIWGDAAFTVPVVPANLSAAGDIVDAAGGDGSLLPVGYLFAALNGRMVGPPPAVLNVDTGETFATIQEAHDDADTLDGHTLRMLVAEHSEGPQIVITKDLTLEGGSVDTIKATGDTTSSGDARGWFLVDGSSDLHVKDLIFDGNGFKIYQAFRHKGTGSFTNCSFHDIQFNSSGPTYAGTAVAAFGAVGPVDVYGGTLDEIGRQGIFFFGSGVNGSICSGITYTGQGVGDHLDYGIEVGGGADVILDGNTITDCTGVASSDGSTSAGILVTTFFGPGTGALVTNCDLTGNTTGLFVGYDGTDTSSVTANFNNFDNVDNGVICTSTTEIVNATDNWWGDPGGPDDPTGTIPAINGFCAPVGDIYNVNTGEDFVSDDNVEYCPWAMIPLSGPPSGSLILAAANCQDDAYPGETGYQIEVTLSMMDLTSPATGFQALLTFNDTALSYRGDLSSYTASPFPQHQRATADALFAPGELRLDGAAPFNDPGTVADSLLATLVFTVNVECSGPSIDFDLGQDFDSELSYRGVPIPTGLTNTGAITVDDTPPTLMSCPTDFSVPADAGIGDGCVGAIVTYMAPTATDNCGGSPTIECSPASGTEFPVGMTTVTCTATDDCGNESECTFVVTVTETNLIDVTVELQGSIATSRCIHFITDDCGTTLDTTLSFTGSVPATAVATIEVDCGPWTQLCAKDEQHTQWDTTPLSLSGDGTRWEADFVLELRAGDTDNDGDVDINDVTWLLFTFGNLAADGDCPWDGTRDADFSNNGDVGSEDYSLFSSNFLTLSGCSCTPGPFEGGGDVAARMSRSTDGLDPRVADRADLNGDRVIDAVDVEIFEAIHGLPNTLSAAMRSLDRNRKTRLGQ